jgi:hypothetical protein
MAFEIFFIEQLLNMVQEEYPLPPPAGTIRSENVFYAKIRAVH